MVDTKTAFKNFIAKLPKKRFQPRDLSTDRSDRYNATHSHHHIASNYMLDRYLQNRNELNTIGVKLYV